jgi:hypothetical protein
MEQAGSFVGEHCLTDGDVPSPFVGLSQAHGA